VDAGPVVGGGASTAQGADAEDSRVVNDAAQRKRHDGTGELTVMVTRGGSPVTGLSAGDLTVRIGKSAVDVVAVEGPGQAPAMLGLAVDLGPESTPDLPWLGRMCGQMAAHDGGEKDRVLVRNRDGRDGGWSRRTDAVASAIDVAEPAAGDLPSLVSDSLQSFEGVRGRTMLVLLTDGRGAVSRGGWKATFDRARRVGVPILVMAIWRDGFPAGLRKDLRRLAELSGGSVFYIQGPVQVDDALERFGAAVDGSYAVAVAASPGSQGVSVAVGDANAVVRASTTVR
jgi:hypothetical protein